MIGGLGPESTVDYYRSIIARYRVRKPDGGYPHVIINSLDVDKGIALLDAGRLGDLADYLAAGLELLVRAGANFGFIASNTPHLVFDEVQRRWAIPLLSIVRATSGYAKALGLKKCGLRAFTRSNSSGKGSPWFDQKSQSGNSFIGSTSMNCWITDFCRRPGQKF
jgi:aspartate racemase